MKLDLQIDSITLRGTPSSDETITAEAIVAAAEAELQRLVAILGAPTQDLEIDLDGLVLEIEPGVTARRLGERIAADIASRWRGLGGTEDFDQRADSEPGLDAGGSAKIE